MAALTYWSRGAPYFGNYKEGTTCGQITNTMISITGKNAYGVLRDLCCLENPKVKTFEKLRDLLLQHSKPKRLEVAGLYRFHRCFQGNTESVF